MIYYTSRHDARELKKGGDFAGIFHTKPNCRSTVKVEINLVFNCFSCEQDFTLENGFEYDQGDFCNKCIGANQE